MQVAILTSDREQSFVHETIESLQGGGEHAVRCVVIGHDGGYLKRWRSQVSIETLKRGEANRLARRGEARQSFHGLLRALSGADATKGLVVCRDDVRFVSSWAKKLRKMKRDAPGYITEKLGLPAHRYVLSLHARYPGGCTFFPRVLIVDMAKQMRRAFGRGRCPPGEVWLKEYCLRKETPILCGIPNLVERLGDAG